MVERPPSATCFRIEKQRETLSYLHLMLLHHWKGAWPANYVSCHWMPRPCCNPCSVSQYLVEFRSAQQPFPSSLLECVPKRRQHWEKLIKLEMVLLLSRFSHVQLCVTPWTIAREAPLSMEFSRQEFWSGFAMPSSRESSQPRDRTWVSCSAGTFVTIWFTKEAPEDKILED